jgi:hypothetical protein
MVHFSLDSPEEVPRVDNATTKSVRSFVEDQRNVDPDKVMPYIFMLARGVHDAIPREVDISGVDCLKKGLEQKVLKKRAITLTKPLLCLELKRRDDKVKPNMNNKKVEDLFAMISEKDLEDSDKEYVKEMTSGFISDITKAIDESNAKKSDTGGRIEMTDRLRWIMAIDLFGDIRIAYMGLQEVLNREQLDARNTASAQGDFHDLVVAKVNDDSWVPETMAIPDLHSTFAEPISCPKRDNYNLTRERSKNLLMEFKHKLNEICKRYDQSGNGSGQLDSDGEEVDERTDERDFGRVNLELAKQKGGDDRQAFIQHEPVDLLYYWDVMDCHDLIHFTTAQLRGSNAVSSESRPALTS